MHRAIRLCVSARVPSQQPDNSALRHVVSRDRRQCNLGTSEYDSAPMSPGGNAKGSKREAALPFGTVKPPAYIAKV